jgi:hypothetical protein
MVQGWRSENLRVSVGQGFAAIPGVLASEFELTPWLFSAANVLPIVSNSLTMATREGLKFVF